MPGPRNKQRPEPTITDHRIGLRNGSTTAIEMTTSRLEASKRAPKGTLLKRVEELSKQNGHLCQEVKFFRSIWGPAHALNEMAYKIAWQLALDYYHETSVWDSAMELLTQVDHFKGAVSEAEDEWLEFWGVTERIESHSVI